MYVLCKELRSKSPSDFVFFQEILIFFFAFGESGLPEGRQDLISESVLSLQIFLDTSPYCFPHVA